MLNTEMNVYWFLRAELHKIGLFWYENKAEFVDQVVIFGHKNEISPISNLQLESYNHYIVLISFEKLF